MKKPTIKPAKKSNAKTAIIIGGGVGGLCTAARLLKNGYQVTVIEKEPKVGGRANRITQAGYSFDTGPTLLMMTDVLYDTFQYCGKNFDDYIELIQLEPNYQVAFADKSKITVSSNLPKFVKELERFDPKAPEQFYKFFAAVSAIYRISRASFIDTNFDRVLDFINPKSGFELLKRRGLSKLYNFVAHYFKDERLRQLFSFQSMYLGVSPHEAPAVYSIVSYMETGLGIWYPKGGMYSLSVALAKLVTDLGGEIRTSTAVDEIIIENKTAVGVKIKNTQIMASTIIANADLIYSHQKLIDPSSRPSMPDTKLRAYKQASSALLFYWGWMILVKICFIIIFIFVRTLKITSTKYSTKKFCPETRLFIPTFQPRQTPASRLKASTFFISWFQYQISTPISIGKKVYSELKTKSSSG